LDAIRPESKGALVSKPPIAVHSGPLSLVLVTVCATLSLFVHVTVSPTDILEGGYRPGCLTGVTFSFCLEKIQTILKFNKIR